MNVVSSDSNDCGIASALPGRVPNRTSIGVEEDWRDLILENDKRWITAADKYERLDKHNRDAIKSREDIQISASVDRDFKKYMVKAFGHEVELPEWLVNVAWKRVAAIDVGKIGMNTELVIFAVLVLLANDLLAGRRNSETKLYYPSQNPEDQDEHFRRLAENLKQSYTRVTTNSLIGMIEQLRRRIN